MLMSLILVESKKFDGFCMISHGDRRMDVKNCATVFQMTVESNCLDLY